MVRYVPVSRFDGSCGRRPITTTSNSRIAIVTPSVMIHSSCETFTKPPVVAAGRECSPKNAGGLFHRHEHAVRSTGRPIEVDVMTTLRRRNTPLRP